MRNPDIFKENKKFPTLLIILAVAAFAIILYYVYTHYQASKKRPLKKTAKSVKDAKAEQATFH